MALAIQILDGTPLRPGGKIPMSVCQAKFEQKGIYHLSLILYITVFYYCSLTVNDGVFLLKTRSCLLLLFGLKVMVSFKG